MIKTALQKCGCLIYYLPRINYNARICTRADSNCYNTIRMSLEQNENSSLCQCTPGCDEISFVGEMSTTPLTITTNKQTPLRNFSLEKIK